MVIMLKIAKLPENESQVESLRISSTILSSYLAQFSAKAQKIKNIYPEKISLHFRKWNFLALLLKIIIFSQKKAFLILVK